MLFLELVTQGLIQGAIYALVALGLTMVYGLLRILHVAHAAFFTLGGYIVVLVSNSTGSLILAFAVAIITSGALGVACYRLCYEAILPKPPFVALIASIGLYIAAQEIFRIAFGAFGLSFNTPPFQEMLSFGGIHLKQAELLMMGQTALIIALLTYVQSGTRVGIASKATVSDPQMAQSFGVSLRVIRDLNFLIGSALAAFAGGWVAILNNLVEPTMGSVAAYKTLAVIVLGGLGSVRGALIASLILGVVESLGTVYLGTFLDRNSIAFAFLIALLLIRPQGLVSSR